jgi:hypothetical protein
LIRHFGHDVPHQGLDIRRQGGISLSREQLGSDRQRAVLRESSTDIPDMLVNTKDFLHDENDRKVLPGGRTREIRG